MIRKTPNRLLGARPAATLDDPVTTQERVFLVQKKRFLRRLYHEWYGLLAVCSQDTPPGPCLELGSGPGFIKDVIPSVLRSEVARMGNIDVVLRAEHMPFPSGELAAIYMTDVLHHIPDPKAFFREAARCLKPGGGVFMIEPAATPWARFVWRYLHHEPFVPQAGWELDGDGPLSTANSALPWIVFYRDRRRFEDSFPELEIRELRPFMPSAYLISGGLSFPSLLPGPCYPLLRVAEKALGPLNRQLGMFILIALRRR